MKESFLLDLDALTFCRWLDDQIALLQGTRIAVDDGYVVLSKARIYSHSTRIDVPALYVESTVEASAPCPIDSVISFEVLPISGSLIRVTCHCHRPETADSYAKILEAIARTWPHTSLARRLGRNALQPRLGRTVSTKLVWANGAPPIKVRAEKREDPEVRKRRRDVKRLYREALKIQKIAERLVVSESTVKRDLSKLRDKGEL